MSVFSPMRLLRHQRLALPAMRAAKSTLAPTRGQINHWVMPFSTVNRLGLVGGAHVFGLVRLVDARIIVLVQGQQFNAHIGREALTSDTPRAQQIIQIIFGQPPVPI